MSPTIAIWFRNLFRPTVTSVEAIVYENGAEQDISKYSDIQLVSLTKCINELWILENKSPYWFETDVYTHSFCFQKSKSSIIVNCLSQDITAKGFKRPFPIPIRFRNKMFDKMHPIKPDPIGPRTWRGNMQVKFVLKK